MDILTLLGIQLEASVVEPPLDLPTVPAVTFKGAAGDLSLCASSSDGSIETEGEEERQVVNRCCSGSFLGRTGENCRSSSTSHSTWPDRPGTRRVFRRKAAPISLVAGVVQIHGREASFVVNVVLPGRQRLMVWTTALQPFLVLIPSCGGRSGRVMSSETVASRAFVL